MPWLDTFDGSVVKVGEGLGMFSMSTDSSQGLCEIEQTERGWYITLIDKDPDSVRREAETERKERMDLDDEQRRQKLIAEQVIELQDNSNTNTNYPFLFRLNEI